MPSNNYATERDAIIRQFENMQDFSWNEQLNGQFALASANLSNFLPHIDASAHAALFAKLLTHKKLGVLEQGSIDALERLTAEGFQGPVVRQLSRGPSIICTFHTGSYRLLNIMLGTQRIPFVLVVGEAILSREGLLLDRIFRGFTGSGLPTINASDPRSVFRMLRELKQGRSLVFYIDGNSGSGEATRNNSNTCIIPLLGGHVHARKGIAVLAAKAQVPVFPVVCYRPAWDDIRLKFFDPVEPALDGQETCAPALTRQLYQLAEPIITRCPEQWEAWLYLHKTAVINAGDQPAPWNGHLETCYQLDRNSFSLLTMGKKHFLMRKNTYSSFEIGQDLYNLLDRSSALPIVPDDQEKSVITRLLQEHVLIKFKNNCRT